MYENERGQLILLQKMKFCSDATAAVRPHHTDERQSRVEICTLDVTWLLKNGQLIPAF